MVSLNKLSHKNIDNKVTLLNVQMLNRKETQEQQTFFVQLSKAVSLVTIIKC